MTTPAPNPAIRFEPDGYEISGPRLMGRQAAGNGFLRAAVAGRGSEPVWAYTPHRASAETFGRLVREIEPAAEAGWLPAHRLDLVAERGTLYWPAPGITEPAQLRLRVGPTAYSICGVTHTTATHAAMDAIAGLVAAPLMPWDALVCTSQAVAATAAALIEREGDYLRWRFGPQLRITPPRLPVISLGVHTADFVFTQAERAGARRELGVGEDEVAALFLGRLSFHAKAHPHAMYLGLQRATQRTGQKIALIQCGWFANSPIEAAFRDGAVATCPDVRALFTDGKDPRRRRQSWAAADLFISLSDNIQETFGLSPVEAMAAGLPLVVTDWNGYKDTIRDGIDGFRIPTWMPAPGFGEDFARTYEAGAINYDLYSGFTCQTVSIDLRVLTDRLSDLAARPELRHRLGAAARRRARELYDWTVVYRQYQELWAELGAVRRAAQDEPHQRDLLQGAPSAAGARPDPYLAFATYPTTSIGEATLVSLAPGSDAARYRQLIGLALFTYADRHLPTPGLAEAMLDALGEEEQSIEALAKRLGLEAAAALRAVSVLAKLGLVQLRQDGGGSGVAG